MANVFNRRTALMGMALALSNLAACNKPADTKPVETTREPNPKSQDLTKTDTQDILTRFLEAEFHAPLKTTLAQAGESKEKILYAVADQTNRTLAKVLLNFPIKNAQDKQIDETTKSQFAAIGKVSDASIDYLIKANILDINNLDIHSIEKYGILYNNDLIGDINSGSCLSLEEAVADSADSSPTFYTSLSPKKEFKLDAPRFKALTEAFQKELNLKFPEKINYKSINDGFFGFMAKYQNGSIYLNTKKLALDAEINGFDKQKLEDMYLVNEALHQITDQEFNFKMGNKVSPGSTVKNIRVNTKAEIDEFLSDIASTMVYPEYFLRRYSYFGNINNNFSSTQAFNIVCDLMEEKLGQILNRKHAASSGSEAIYTYLKEELFKDKFETEFIPEFQKRMLSAGKEAIAILRKS